MLNELHLAFSLNKWLAMVVAMQKRKGVPLLKVFVYG